MSSPRPRKKTRRARSIRVEVAAPLPPLISLPLAVQEHLLTFLPVTSLQLLASTCTFLHQLIHGRTITNLEFPFTPAFLQELTSAFTIDKKPLLRLTCHEANLPCTWHPYSRRARKVELIAEIQLALLDLTRLRELVLVPNLRVSAWVRSLSPDMISDMLATLADQDRLGKVTRLEVPLASILASIKLDLLCAETRQARVLDMLARLLRLHLVVNTRAELNQLGEGSLLMAHIKPVSLAITVMPSVRITRKTVKEVTSPWVEELALHLPSVEGEEGAALHSPCLLQFRLRMAILRRVTVTSPPGEACALLAASDPQPALHRAGGCGVDVRSLWEGCPLVTTFNGIPLEVQGVGWSPEGGEGYRARGGQLWVTRNHLGRSYREWMAGTRKAFHRDYRARGGQLGLQAWARTRWSPRQVKLQAALNYGQI